MMATTGVTEQLLDLCSFSFPHSYIQLTRLKIMDNTTLFDVKVSTPSLPCNCAYASASVWGIDDGR